MCATWSRGMPMPVSRTSMRTSVVSCRQRSSTQPSRVYLMAFETRFLRIWPTRDGSLCTQSAQASTRSSIPLLAATLANSRRSSSNSAATLKSVISGLIAPDSSLLMSSSEFSSRDIDPDGLTLVLQRLDHRPLADHAPQGAIEHGERLQRLAQVVARCREEPALRLVGAVGGFAAQRAARLRRACGRSRRGSPLRQACGHRR